jgi:hypothetical protein
MVPPESVKDGPLISPAEVRRRLATGESPVVLDARGRAAFTHAKERVAGDLRASGRDLSALIAALDVLLKAEPKRSAWLLAYCT